MNQQVHVGNRLAQGHHRLARVEFPVKQYWQQIFRDLGFCAGLFNGQHTVVMMRDEVA